jgi:hypothetical protein
MFRSYLPYSLWRWRQNLEKKHWGLQTAIFRTFFLPLHFPWRCNRLWKRLRNANNSYVSSVKNLKLFQMLASLGGPFMLRGTQATHSNISRRHLNPIRPRLDCKSGYNFNWISQHSSSVTILGRNVFLFLLSWISEQLYSLKQTRHVCLCVIIDPVICARCQPENNAASPSN